MSNTDTLQELRKNKKEMEFELKLAKEKEGMYEREKQLKISRLVQEVWTTYCYSFHGLALCHVPALLCGYVGNSVVLGVTPLSVVYCCA